MRREGWSRSAMVTADVMLPATLALALVVGAGLPTSAWAAGPEETIRELVSAVSEVLNDPGRHCPIPIQVVPLN